LSKGVRLLSLAAAAIAAALAAPAGAAPRPVLPANVLIVADVGESAQHSMPAALWRKLVVEYVGARTATAEDGTSLPDEARCRSAHALYAIFATFERAMRLPGVPQDPDRIYGIARFTVRNCATGAVSPVKTVRVESDPLSEAQRGDFEPVSERTWDRAIRATLARNPLSLTVDATTLTAAAATGTAPIAATTVGRIIRVENGIVYIKADGGFAADQILNDYADRDAKPHPPIELVVIAVSGKYVTATIIGNGAPRAGDYVAPAAPASPSPAPRR
jgi:hypothetical protein